MKQDTQEKLTALSKKCQELQQILSQKDNHIMILNQTRENAQNMTSNLFARYQDTQKKLEQVIDNLTSANKLIHETQAQNQALNSFLVERDHKINNLYQIIKSTETALLLSKEQFIAVETMLKKILASRSWKITRPIRLMVRIIKWVISCVIVLFKRYKIMFKIILTKKSEFSVPSEKILNISGNQTVISETFVKEKNHDLSVITEREYYVDNLPEAPKQKCVRAIAFYLPQFHPIPQNDAWWGLGFTEWTNVSRAIPQFEGHYQPHLPGELGFYDLRLPEIQQRQVQLAKSAGLEGFCFYFYWFHGTRLLEAPILQYLAHPEFDLPFCLCWANENWTKRWNGSDQEILMTQYYSEEDDIAFISYIAKYFRDPRYIKIKDKPVLLVYRPNAIPNASATSARWRRWARENGIGELFLIYTQSFPYYEDATPAQYGFDAACEFPPSYSQASSLLHQVKLINQKFAGCILDWRDFLETSQQYETPSYQLFRSVCPSWDNEARRLSAGTIFINSSPPLFQQWLYNAAVDTIKRFPDRDERLVFINAWNEWAEGCHLEPDKKYGYAWLRATQDAIVAANAMDTHRRIVVVSHDAHPHGAQFLALYLTQMLTKEFGFKVAVVLLGSGKLKEKFEEYAIVYDLTDIDHQGDKAENIAQQLYAQGYRSALCNTTVSGNFLATLTSAGLICICLIHELTTILESYHLQKQAKSIIENAHAIIFSARIVEKAFINFAGVPSGSVHIQPQGLFKKNRTIYQDRSHAHEDLCKKLNVPLDSKIVLGMGCADRRKGFELFAQIGKLVAAKLPHVYFVWVGHWDNELYRTVEAFIHSNNISKHFLFPGFTEDTDLFYLGADVFALTLLEDPFPSVVLQALEVGVPVIAFKGTSGVENLLSQCGIVVDFEDCQAFANASYDLLTNAALNQQLGNLGIKLIADQFSFRHYVFDLLKILNSELKRISVIIPNYNYAHFIEDRLNSILQQNYPIYELILLDDGSTEDSVQRIENILKPRSIPYRLIVNEKNSASVFKQWQCGIEMARGDYIWIAEADDMTLPNFLTETMKGFEDKEVVLSYCESKQMSSNGHILCDNYRDYIADISTTKWCDYYINNGKSEIGDVLAVKNTIPNVSGVIFRRVELVNVFKHHFEEIIRFPMAGDWVVYLLQLTQGKIAFSPKSLNLHRRHANSKTLSHYNKELFAEIRDIQVWIKSQYELSPNVLKLAESYLKKLAVQFNLNEPLFLEEVE